jgi:hypothetical protein
MTINTNVQRTRSFQPRGAANVTAADDLVVAKCDRSLDMLLDLKWHPEVRGVIIHTDPFLRPHTDQGYVLVENTAEAFDFGHAMRRFDEFDTRLCLSHRMTPQSRWDDLPLPKEYQKDSLGVEYRAILKSPDYPMFRFYSTVNGRDLASVYTGRSASREFVVGWQHVQLNAGKWSEPRPMVWDVVIDKRGQKVCVINDGVKSVSKRMERLGLPFRSTKFHYQLNRLMIELEQQEALDDRGEIISLDEQYVFLGDTAALMAAVQQGYQHEAAMLAGYRNGEIVAALKAQGKVPLFDFEAGEDNSALEV